MKITIPARLDHQWTKLDQILQSSGSAAICYSGGVDSSFLSWAAYTLLDHNMVAVTIQSPADPPDASYYASLFAEEIGFRQVIIPLNLLENPGFRSNPIDRCYHCKKQILATVWEFARQEGIATVMDGQNIDDLQDYRPGRKAVQESGTISPLIEAGFTKADIRDFAKANHLSIWDRPASPCLATRIPYGQGITPKSLAMIGQAEEFLHQNGYPISRVRMNGNEARIEVPLDRMDQLFLIRTSLVIELTRLGFSRITLDLNGYRSGNLYEGIK